MHLSDIQYFVGQLERTVADNALVSIAIGVAFLLAGLIFGGLVFDGLLTRKRARDKARAAERLRKHLESLPSIKS
jgi:hypothetical protein